MTDPTNPNLSACEHDFEAINQWQTICRKCGVDLDSVSAPSGSDLGEGVLAVIRKWEAGLNHDEAHFRPDCTICLILADLRAALFRALKGTPPIEDDSHE